MRPLDRLPSIKLKLGTLILAAVAVSALISSLGYRYGVPLWLRPVIAAAVALLLVQVLSRGMTSPLREMAAAAKAMARGDYGRRVTSTSQDEVGELARAFNQMAAELAEVDRVRKDLVANVSHELRTPIASLRAVLENLVDGVSEPDPATFKTMLEQVERLGRLVAQLLDLSKLESGTVPLQRQPFRAADVMQRAAAEAALPGPGPEIDVAVLPPELLVHGDPERIHQVVANLLDNAVRFSPERGRVRVTVTDVDGWVRIAVDDDGPGIPAGEESRVFERFYRADRARAASDGGSGLGLAIARWIVDLHGGDIRAERRQAGGCRMVVDLPAVAS